MLSIYPFFSFSSDGDQMASERFQPHRKTDLYFFCGGLMREVYQQANKRVKAGYRVEFPEKTGSRLLKGNSHNERSRITNDKAQSSNERQSSNDRWKRENWVDG